MCITKKDLKIEMLDILHGICIFGFQFLTCPVVSISTKFAKRYSMHMLKGPFIGPEAGGPTNYLP